MCIQKVISVITCKNEMLIFKHPHAGFQFIKGTVEENELTENAVKRETFEETGLLISSTPKYLFTLSIDNKENSFWIISNSKVFSRPSNDSFDWITLQRGIHVNKLKENNTFTQIEYSEWNDIENPEYITYSFIGWIPTKDITNKIEYLFYNLEIEKTEQAWDHFSDNHLYNIQWVNKNSLPKMAGIQNQWKETILRAL